jgi:hypothetical protein
MEYCWFHKVLTFVENRAVEIEMSGVFHNIDQLPLSTKIVCLPPAPKAGGLHTRRADGVGGGSIFWKTPDISIGLLQCNSSTAGK